MVANTSSAIRYLRNKVIVLVSIYHTTVAAVAVARRLAVPQIDEADGAKSRRLATALLTHPF
jgi:hypothetical protein